MSSPLFEIQRVSEDDNNNDVHTRVDPKSIVSSSSSIFLVSKTLISEEPLTTEIVASGDESPAAAPTTDHQSPTPSGDATPSRSTSGRSPSQTGDFAANGASTPQPESSNSPDGTTATSPSPDNQNPKESSEMSVATKAGIGVGASIGGIALMAGTALLIAKYGKMGRSRAGSVMATSMLFWCKGRQSTQS